MSNTELTIPITISSIDFLHHDDRKKIIQYIESLNLEYFWGIRFIIGVPGVHVLNDPVTANLIEERFLSVLHNID